MQELVVADTTKVRIFKQITTIQQNRCNIYALLLIPQRYEFSSKSQQDSIYLRPVDGCCWYHKGTNFQANHNRAQFDKLKQELLLIPQRYEFSSKSQPLVNDSKPVERCCWYHKGTNFQANHNTCSVVLKYLLVVADTTKVRIFKQITTRLNNAGKRL